MKDKLEKFIAEHRDDLDLYDPPVLGWQAINKELPDKGSKVRFATYVAAASVVFIICSFVWFTYPPAQKNMAEVNAEAATAPEIKEAETYYTSVVQSKITEISRYAKEYPDLYKDFEGEIDTLHTSYNQLKVEYTNSNGNEAVLQALIGNLQLQVALTNKELEIIENIKKMHIKKERNI